MSMSGEFIHKVYTYAMKKTPKKATAHITTSPLNDVVTYYVSLLHILHVIRSTRNKMSNIKLPRLYILCSSCAKCVRYTLLDNRHQHSAPLRWMRRW